MQNPKRILAALLSAALLFTTACSSAGSSGGNGGNGGGNVGASIGRYLETDITPPMDEEGEQTPVLYQAADGSLVCFNDTYTKKWTSQDGGDSWQETTGPILNPDDIAFITNATLLEDGSLVAQLITTESMMNGSYTYTLLRFYPDGRSEPVAISGYDAKEAEGKGPYLGTLMALPDGRLLVSYYWGGMGFSGAGSADEEDEDEGATDAMFNMGEMPTDMGTLTEVYDLATGALLYSLGDASPNNAAVDGSTLYLDMGYGEVLAYNLADGSELPSPGAFTDAQYSYYSGFAARSDGSLWKATSNAIEHLKNGEPPQSELSGTAFSFGDPNSGIMGLFTLADGRFIIDLMLNDGTRHFYRYEWDENASYDPEKTLKIWSMDDSPSVRATINAFRKKHPDALVEYEVARLGGDDLDSEEIIKKLNIEILAGTGPDILVLDGLPIESYIGKEVLADLKGLVDTSGVYESLLSGFTAADGGLYFLPTRFKSPLVLGNTEDVAQVNTLAALVDYVKNKPQQKMSQSMGMQTLPAEERPALSLQNFDELWNTLWSTSASALVEDNTLNTAALRELYTALKEISDFYGLLDIPPDEMTSAVLGFAIAGTTTSSTMTGSIMNYMMGRALLGSYTADDLYMLHMFNENPDAAIRSLAGLVEGAWAPVSMVGITESSTNKSFAAEFINAMLSDEVQATRTMGGLPVTRNGMQAQIDEINRNEEKWLEEGETPVLFGFDMDALVGGLKIPVLVDDELKGKFYNAALGYCEGSVDLDTAISNLERELKNYLAERE